MKCSYFWNVCKSGNVRRRNVTITRIKPLLVDEQEKPPLLPHHIFDNYSSDHQIEGCLTRRLKSTVQYNSDSLILSVLFLCKYVKEMRTVSFIMILIPPKPNSLKISRDCVTMHTHRDNENMRMN